MSSRLQCYLRRWARNLASRTAFSAVFASFGALWLCLQIATFFLPDEKTQWLRDGWWPFLVLALTAAAWRCKPRHSFSHRVAGRDVTIKIAVGDVFDYTGALVVGSNTTFDTEVSEALISEKSVQGTFTRNYSESVSKLDGAIESELRGLSGTALEGERVGKSKRYPLGTTVRVEQRSRVAYFVAIAHINEHGSARGDLEGLREALAALWSFARERGGKEELVTPVLGTGFSRLAQRRDLVVREIVKSFIAACSESVLTERLTIVLYPRDVLAHSISLDELDAYVGHVCRYSDFSALNAEQIGSAVVEQA